MKIKFFIIVAILTMLIIPTISAEKSINEIMVNIDEYSYLVIGENALGGDISAAGHIKTGISNNNYVDLETVLEGEIGNSLSKILLGPPCGSEYMEEALGYPCDNWPYDEGHAIIKVNGNDLIVTGTEPNDRRRAALILENYPDYQELKDHSFILVVGNSLSVSELTIEKAKLEEEFVCGDGICEIGENFFCFPDCQKKSCYDICQEENYTISFCRKIPTNPNVEICEIGEINKGMKYCTNQRSCCCKNEEKPEIEIPQVPEPTINDTKEEIKPNFLSRLTETGTVKLVVMGAIVLLTIILLIGFALNG
jgi:hypothetical protein